MRWSIVRLIWFRELRDQLRDRRTVFMIAVLPLLIYPILGVAVLQLAVGFVDRPSIIGLVGGQHLPPLTPASAGLSPIPWATWLAYAPVPSGGAPVPWDRILGP